MRAWLFLVAVLGTGTALDQLSKHWAETEIQPRGIVTLVPDVLDLRYVRNPGAFFSMGGTLSPDLRRVCFVTASLGVLLLMAWLYPRIPQGHWRPRTAFALLAGGALGNLIDRVQRGEVVDFVHLHAGSALSWAIFNLADVLITFGLGLLVLDRFRPTIAPNRAGELAPAAPLDGGY